MHAVSSFKSQTIALKSHRKCGFACPCTVENCMSHNIKQKMDKHILMVQDNSFHRILP